MSKAWRGLFTRAPVVVLVVSLAACSNGASGGDPAPSPTESESVAAENSQVDKSRTFPAAVLVEGTGAAPFAWEGQQDVMLTRVGGAGLDVNLLSAGFQQPQILPDDPALRFRWAFDLLGDYRDEPGTFQIGGDSADAQGLQDVAFLIWMRVKDPSKEAVYDMAEVEYLKEFREIREPCTLEVDGTGSKGTMTCPALATADGEVAGLTVTWEEVSA